MPPHYNTSGDYTTAAAPLSSTNDLNATLRVTTKFVQPWTEQLTDPNVSHAEPPFFFSDAPSDGGGQVSLDDFFSQFAMNEALWTQPEIGPSGPFY